MMDNTGDGSEVDLAFPIGVGREIPHQTYRPRLLIQDVAANGLGGYAALQGAAVFGADGQDPGYSIGNLELGGLYQVALSPHFDLAARVGVALPTATSGDSAQIWNTFASAVIRPADLVTSDPGTWLRFGVSPSFHRGIAFARVDLGVDVAVAGQDEFHNENRAHANVGAGVALGALTATAELEFLDILDSPGDFNFHTLSTAGVSARYAFERLSPYLLVSSPLESYRGDYVTVTAGLTTML
jgi:hypothetical protein